MTAEALKQSVWAYAKSHGGQKDLIPTPLTGIEIMHVEAPNNMVHTIYKPLVCLVLGGAKQVTFGPNNHSFSAGQSAIISLDLPVVGRVVRATPDDPYLAFAMELDMGVMRELMTELGNAPPAPTASPQAHQGIVVDNTDDSVSDCALRLMRLLERPQAIPVLKPALVREMHYWLLVGQHGSTIRRLARFDSHAERISRAIAILRVEFANAIPVERLAAAAGMSASSFHQHFKALTSLSPIQFQKRLRLIEARRLMLDEGLGATHAALAVGYESPSQFTREYGRMFGAPPRRDAIARKNAA